jgi:mannose-1-phosphate guanylyltransferase
MYAAILAGGVGTRLWPRSRQTHPKQFADITGTGRTMIQATADRLHGLVAPNELFVVTGVQYGRLAAAQLPDIPPQNILQEPSGRNTAPAIGLVCLQIQQRDPNAIVAILHSDHVIPQADRFRDALRHAHAAAEAGYIVTLGVPPTFAHTGYGYIQCGDMLTELPDSEAGVYRVARFLEKPDLPTAQSFLAQGGFFWNAGIFVTRVDVMLHEIERQIPALAAALAQIDTAQRRGDGSIDAVMAAVWPHIPNISIDHGILEGAQAVATVPLDAGWNDVGSWDALEAILPADADGNVVVRGDLLNVASHGNVIFADKQVVALIGVDNLVVVDTGDTLLIGQKQQMQKVKEVVERLRALGRSDLL